MLSAVAALAIAVTVAGCGGGDDASSDAPADGGPAPKKVSTEGPFFGLCGSVTDDEVKQAFNVPQLPVVTRNSVGCVWEASGSFGPSVSFSWYRGSPIGRESAGSGLIGRPPDTIEIDGHPGFKGSAGEQLCEIGVQFGDSFMHWSVTYADFPPTADACEVAKKLAELTVSRTPK